MKWEMEFDDAIGNEHDDEFGMWWLARYVDGSKLLPIYTRGISDQGIYYCDLCPCDHVPSFL